MTFVTVLDLWRLDLESLYCHFAIVVQASKVAAVLFILMGHTYLLLTTLGHTVLSKILCRR